MTWWDDPIAPPPEEVQRFKELVKKELGTEYTDREVFEGATNLLNFFRVLLHVDHKLTNARISLIITLRRILKNSQK